MASEKRKRILRNLVKLHTNEVIKRFPVMDSIEADKKQNSTHPLKKPVMQRPEIVYLDTAIFIKGMRVMHTEEGLKYLIDHYTHLLTIPTKRDQQVYDHMVLLIENWKQHLSLYEQTKNSNPYENNNSTLQQSI